MPKSYTFTVDGIDADLWHYNPILRRRSRCFPRRLETLKAVLELFVQAYNAFGISKMKFRKKEIPNLVSCLSLSWIFYNMRKLAISKIILNRLTLIICYAILRMIDKTSAFPARTLCGIYYSNSGGLIMEIIKGGITSAKGFNASSTGAGIKYGNRDDMAMVYSDVPCVAYGVFTSNVVKAAPVIWDRDIVEKSPYVQAIVVNSGIANACTGEIGLAVCRETAEKTASMLDIPSNAVLVCSTGIIGKQLPIDKIKKGIENLSKDLDSTYEKGHKAACAIMTTDTVSKEYAVQFNIGCKTVTIGAMCKGSGMIHPNMCTMLAFITTDICISKDLLKKAIKNDVLDSFNMISIDGDTSTNDSLLVLANGMAENEMITEENDDYSAFCAALQEVTKHLSKMIASDGEGSTTLMEVTIKNADTKEHARIMARSVVSSSLVKSAIYGNDANWGRIPCALGYSGIEFNQEIYDIYYISSNGNIQVVKNGLDSGYDESIATKILSSDEVIILVDLKMGHETATAWGCDLTYDYVKINADYRS